MAGGILIFLVLTILTSLNDFATLPQKLHSGSVMTIVDAKPLGVAFTVFVFDIRAIKAGQHSKAIIDHCTGVRQCQGRQQALVASYFHTPDNIGYNLTLNPIFPFGFYKLLACGPVWVCLMPTLW